MDFELAKYLQREEELRLLEGASDDHAAETNAWGAQKRLEHKITLPGQGRIPVPRVNRPLALNNADAEALDPTPDLRGLFQEYNRTFFEGRLEACEVRWSPRMTRCAGLCLFESGGYCSIRLSAPLLRLRPRSDFNDTLLVRRCIVSFGNSVDGSNYSVHPRDFERWSLHGWGWFVVWQHEMIHAYLFITQNNRDREGHGAEFQRMMHHINAIAGTSISVFHTFHDEVSFYQRHVWRCTGSCRHRPPFFGYVRRAMNRAPSPKDNWWDRHRAMCSGVFEKVASPEPGLKMGEVAPRASNRQPAKTSDPIEAGTMDLRRWMTGGPSFSSPLSSKPTQMPVRGPQRRSPASGVEESEQEPKSSGQSAALSAEQRDDLVRKRERPLPATEVVELDLGSSEEEDDCGEQSHREEGKEVGKGTDPPQKKRTRVRQTQETRRQEEAAKRAAAFEKLFAAKRQQTT